MKRIALFAAAIALLGGAATALASTDSYGGDLKSGTVTFNIVTKHGKTFMTAFRFKRVPISCRGGDVTASGKDPADKFPVTDDKFKAVLRATSADFKSKLVFAGKIKNSGAKGTFRLSGKKVPIDGSAGVGSKCDTGTIDWKAG